MRYAIHQPNFFPWLGYFDRIQKVDRFIFFDHVALPGGRSIVQRVRVLGPKEPVWLTLPIEKSGKLGQRICEARIRDAETSFASLLDKLRNYYRLSPYYREVIAFVETLFPKTESLSQYNGEVIESISKKLGFATEFFYSSSKPELLASESVRTEMILETCEAFGVQDYISGKGCLDFLEVEAFGEKGVALSFQEFDHPIFKQQKEEFHQGLSVLDALFCLGFEGTKEALECSLSTLSS